MVGSREIQILTYPVVLKLGKNSGGGAAEVPVKFQSDTIIIISNRADSRPHEIERNDVRPPSE